MTRVTVLGAGAMGSRIARRLAGAGHAVTVWNREAARAEALADVARIAATPRAAVADAEVAIAMLRDDAASATVWSGPDGALAALPATAVAVESSTLSPTWVRELATRFAGAGRTFVDAPVVGSRPQAEAGQLVVLAGGSTEALATLAPTLAAYASRVHATGAVGSGTVAKLVVNALFAVQLAALAEWLPAAAGAGLAPATLRAALAATPVLSPAANGAAGLMLAQAHAPSFPLELVAKDLGYALQLAGGNAAAPVTTTVAALVERAIGRGWGGDNVTALARLHAG
ncbi:MAG: NAD(P)-dependent oxidoreductase [Steroidobacteraceae bacterium]|jgi:3-hydroxyisobutyrate dehydrogenase|nr:NAD(P)-dependent oxidoreductase [Steroidobacteraceae bacterium]